MNVRQLKDRIYQHTNQTFTDEFHMLALMNDALRQLVDIARLRGTQTINTIIGTSAYALPTNFKSPGVLVDDTDKDYQIPYELVDISENRFGYAIESGFINIKPVPQDVRTLTHYYYKYATELAAEADIPEIDANYHDLLTQYAAGMILMLPQLTAADKGLSDRLMGRWDAGKQTFQQSMQRKNKATRGRDVVYW